MWNSPAVAELNSLPVQNKVAVAAGSALLSELLRKEAGEDSRIALRERSQQWSALWHVAKCHLRQQPTVQIRR